MFFWYKRACIGQTTRQPSVSVQPLKTDFKKKCRYRTSSKLENSVLKINHVTNATKVLNETTASDRVSRLYSNTNKDQRITFAVLCTLRVIYPTVCSSIFRYPRENCHVCLFACLSAHPPPISNRCQKANPLLPPPFSLVPPPPPSITSDNITYYCLNEHM